MLRVANALTILVALEHIGFMILEMALWRQPLGLKVFHMSQEHADSSAALAINQGLYNGFLAAGLLWSLAAYRGRQAVPIQSFFLVCVAVAGCVGGITVSPRIALIQALPAIVALLLLRAQAVLPSAVIPIVTDASVRSGG